MRRVRAADEQVEPTHPHSSPLKGDDAAAIAPARRVVFACDASGQDSASFCVNSSANALRSVPFRGYEGLKWASVKHLD